MASLQQRLGRLRGAGPGATPAPVPVPPPLAVALPWEIRATAAGPLHLLLLQQDEDFAHGHTRLGACRQLVGEQLGMLALCDAWADVDLSRLLFLDTETTGLAGGAGTLPFVVGLGYFTAAGWCTEQLVLHQPGPQSETPLLQHLATRLRAASGLVTFNGKSFDWPLLRTRFIINRVPLPPLLHHLDLLHCVRRLYKRQIPSLRLVHLEARLLDFVRQDDIDGAQIPERYFAYLRGAPAQTLSPILQHNAYDLHAMAALLAVLGERLRQPPATLAPGDCLSMAELLLRAGRLPQAQAAAHAVCTPSPSPVQVSARLLVADMCRRQRDHAGERTALLAALHGCPDDLLQQRAAIHLRLAILHEHRFGALAVALQHARQAAQAQPAAAFAHRLARLQRKQARQAGRISELASSSRITGIG